MLGLGHSATRLTGQGAAQYPFTPGALFDSPGALGGYWDPSSTGGMFQDIKGRVRVAGPDDPVALILDGAQGVMAAAGAGPLAQRLSGQGAELFAAPYSTIGNFAGNGDGSFTCTGDGSGTSYVYKDGAGIVVGDWYLVSFEVFGFLSGGFRARVGTSADDAGIGPWQVANGMAEVLLRGDGAGGNFWIEGTPATQGSVRAVSVRHLPGLPALQEGGDSFRPLLMQEPGSGAWYLSNDQAGDRLTVPLPDLGADATEWRADETGVVINGGQTITAGPRDFPVSQRLYAYGVANRALTTVETANLTAWLNSKRGV
ncbi:MULTISPECIES: hypothetical protein [Leisingera]|uniref:hypothetical protein n=1 Tax=Leisingera TaxID=191028 RepID=UPI0004219CA6|nr:MULTISPECIES: hypothetical protein [Leisingera]